MGLTLRILFKIAKRTSQRPNSYRVSKKKVLHKIEEKMHTKMKITLQGAKHLVQVQQHYGITFYEKIFFHFFFMADMTI